jgi:hypothetical protein
LLKTGAATASPRRSSNPCTTSSSTGRAPCLVPVQGRFVYIAPPDDDDQGSRKQQKYGNAMAETEAVVVVRWE